MNAIVSIAAVGITLFAWVSIFKIVPDCTVSFFRYHLWRLRDQIVDDIRHGKFRDERCARDLVDQVEASIENAKDLTIFRLVLLRLSAMGVTPPHIVEPKDVGLVDRELFTKYFDELDRAMLSQVLRGSPSGWVCVVLLLPVFVILELVSRMRGKDDGGGSVLQVAKTHVKAFELVDPAIAVASRSANGHSRARLHQSI